MTRNNTSEERETNTIIHITYAITDAVSKIFSVGIKWGTLIYFIYAGTDVLKAFAGHETLANISFNWMMNEHLAALLGGIFGTGGIIYGRRQAQLRRDVIERMHPYQVEYETRLDQQRSSSGLTVRGDTRKEDS